MDPDQAAVEFNEFVALARDEGLLAIEVAVVQAPNDANGQHAVVQATARSAQNAFSAIGEAAPMTASVDWHPFLTTLAEYRAKARALRELTGLDHAVLEEMDVPYLTRPPGQSQPAAASVSGMARVVDRSAPAATAVQPSRPQPPVARPAVTPPVAPVERGPLRTDDDIADEEMDESPSPIDTERTAASQDDEPAPDFEGIGRDLEAKLLRLAVSIAEREGEHLSEAEARQKLDDFFNRAFKHPLSRATRLEGQRVVQRLSSDLVRLRSQNADDRE